MSGTSKDNTRAEEFKRATAGVLRAIAEVPDVQVTFQPGPSVLSGKRVRLPLPTRALPTPEVAKLRGAADAIALRLRHHDADMHAARMPARARRATCTMRWSRPASKRSVPITWPACPPICRQAAGRARPKARPDDPQGSASGHRRTRVPRTRADVRPGPPGVRRRDPRSVARDARRGCRSRRMAELGRAQDRQRAFARAARKLLAVLDLAEAEAEAEPANRPRMRAGRRTIRRPGQRKAATASRESRGLRALLGAQPEHAEGEVAP